MGDGKEYNPLKTSSYSYKWYTILLFLLWQSKKIIYFYGLTEKKKINCAISKHKGAQLMISQRTTKHCILHY